MCKPPGEFHIDDLVLSRRPGGPGTRAGGASATATKAPADVAVFQGHAYKVFTERLGFAEARQACSRLGGHLLTLTSAEEETFVADLMTKAGVRATWLDLVKEGNALPATWGTGEGMTYNNAQNRHWAEAPPGALGYGRLGESGRMKPWTLVPANECQPETYVCEWEKAPAGR